MPISGSAATVNLRPDLAAFYEFDLEMDRQGFVGTKVLPVIDVQLQADNPGRIPLEQLLFKGNTERASGSGYGRGNIKFERFTYATQENGWEEPIDDRDKNRYRELLDAELVATARAYSVVTRNHEQRAASAVFNTATWTGSALTTTITHEWDDFTNAVPLTDVEAAVRKVLDGSGLWANALVINRKVFRNLRSCDQVIERIESAGAGKPSTAGDVTAEMLAAAFDLEHVIVAGASKNSANEGQAAAPTQIWSDEYAMVCRVSNSADIRDACIGRTFHWSADGSSIGGTIEQYRDETIRSEVIRVRHDTDEVIMYPQAGHLLSNVTT